jgi:penicillin amidase
MNRAIKGLVILGVVLLVLAVVIAAAATWFVRRPWSKVDGTISVPGLQEPVEVLRDEWGVPHIYAETEHDLFFAQGYVHAQDRLWQMEFNRRVGSGTLSAVLGEATLETDQFLRTIGLRRAAERDWEVLDGESRGMVEDYASGINAYIELHRDRLPLEFTILGVDPEPWTPVDIVAWGKVMSLSLCGNYEMELLRAHMIAELGAEAAQQLMPPYAGGTPLIVPAEVQNYDGLRGTARWGNDALATVLGGNRSDWGSNNWVVHGDRTSTGKPFLADDTHLGLDMPSIWYENGLHGGRYDSVGFSFPGTPMVVIGHNGRIAWGVTNLPADVQDFYIERLDDGANPTRYEFEGQWSDLEVVPETIEVKGAEAVTVEVLITRHGPIMNGVIGSLEGAEPHALKWTALEGGYLFDSLRLINLATNWDEFRHALSFWDAPSQNFVYADVEGNIGYQMPGKVPMRVADHQGTVPVPGWTGDYEWQGYIPFDELPSVLNPPVGYLVTANNKVVSDDYPHLITHDWSAPYRAQRITDLLAANDQVTAKDIRDIQAQTYSLPGEALQPYLDAVVPENDRQSATLALVQGWDLHNDSDSPGASIYQAWYWRLVQDTLRDELGDDLMEAYLESADNHVPAMIDLMAQPDSPWFDDTDTTQIESRDDIVQRSFASSVAGLAEQHGEDPNQWDWGGLHSKTFIHQPLGVCGIGPIEGLFNSKTLPARGDSFTVDAAWYDYTDPFAMTGGSSQRLIADLGNLENSQTMHTTGQSGQLGHPHREDMIELWEDVRHHPTLFTRSQADRHAKSLLTLTPP